MKQTKRILALILALVLLLTPMVSVNAAESDTRKTLYYFDLEEFLNTLPNSQLQYDYYKMATALQGLVNREVPQLYFFSFNNTAPSSMGYDMDEYWFSQITDTEKGYGELADGGDLSDFKTVKLKSFWKMLDIFSEYYNGFVLWDEEVPSTANVASTIAGVENLLPVRKALTAYDLYVALLDNGFKTSDIKRDLTDMFSGEGFIPTWESSLYNAKLEYTTTPSTQSQKTDPYIWAKMFYLDTGLTHPLHMTYSVDGRTQQSSTWNADPEATAALSGELISADIPKRMAPGELRKITLTYLNTGTEAWAESTYDRFALTNQLRVFKLHPDAQGKQKDTSDYNRIKLSKTVESEETYQVVAYLKAPTTEGTYDLWFSMNREMHGAISTRYTARIVVEDGAGLTAEDKFIPYQPLEKVEFTATAKDASIVKVGVDESVAPSATGKAKVVVKNVGTEAWDSSYALQYKVGSAAAATIAVRGTVEVGTLYEFEVPYTAPASGKMDIKLQMLCGSEKVGAEYTGSVGIGANGGAADLGAEILSVSCPKSMTAGTKSEVVVEVLNTGAKAWTSDVKLVDATSNGYISGAGVDDDSMAFVNSIAVEPGVTVQPGDTYRFHIDLHTYTNNGTKKAYLPPKTVVNMELQVNNGATALTGASKLVYEILEVCDTPTTEFAKASDYKLTNYEYNARFLSAAMPTTMKVGELVPIQLEVLNIGTATWQSIKAGKQYMRLAFRGAQNGFQFVTNIKTGEGDCRDKNRVDIAQGISVAPGDVYTYTAWLKAPDTAGVYDVRLDTLLDTPTTWGTADKTFPITVTDGTSSASVLTLRSAPVMKAAAPAAEAMAENAQFVSVNVEKTTAAPNEAVPFSITFKNNGTSAWTKNDMFRLGINGTSEIKLADKADGTNSVSSSANRLFLSKSTVAAGEEYTFNGWLKMPATAGDKAITLQIVHDGKGFIGEGKALTIKVDDGLTAPVVPVENSEFVSAEIPTTAEPGAVVPFSITLKNNGNVEWKESEMFRLGIKDNTKVKLATAADGTSTDSGSRNRIKLKNAVAGGASYTFTGFLVMPDTEGDVLVTLQMVHDGASGFFGASKAQTIQVKAAAAPAATISIELPAKSEPYAELSATASAKNATTTAWAVPAGVTAPVETVAVDGVYLKYIYPNPFNPVATNKKNPSTAYAPLSAAAAAGANASFAVKFNAPVVEGTYDLKAQVVSVSGGKETVLVDEVAKQYVVASATAAATPAGTTTAANKSATYKMEYVNAKIPATMKVGESAFVSISYKNTGAYMQIMSTSNPTQGQRVSVCLCAQSGAGGFKLLDYGFSFATGGIAHDDWALKHVKANQLHLREGQPERVFNVNDTRTFTGVLTAPATPGTYTLSFAGFSGTETYASDMTNFTVTVVDPNAKPIELKTEAAEPYTEKTLTATAKNATTSAWAVPTGVTAPVETVAVDGVYLKYNYPNPFNPTANNKKNPFEFYAPLKAATAAGATAEFAVKYTTPVVEGTYDLKAQVVSVSGKTESVLVDEVTASYESKSATAAATPAGTTTSENKSATYKMEYVNAKIPATMKVGESAFVSISYKNTGAWMQIMNSSFGADRATVGLVAQSGAGGFTLTDYGLGLAETAEKEVSWAKTHAKLKNQLNLREGRPERVFDVNETRTFTGVLTAPATAGTYTLSFAGLAGAVTPASDMTNFTVTVIDPNAKDIMTGISKTAEPYEKMTLAVKAKNESKVAWTVPAGVKDPVPGFTVTYGTKTWAYGVKPTVAGTYLKYTYVNPWNPTTESRIPYFVYYAPLSADTAVGADGTFNVTFNTPVVEGNYELKTQVVSISGSTETVLVDEVVDAFEVKTATPKATVAGTATSDGKSATYKTEFVEAKIPATMKAGESVFVSLTYKNLSTDMSIMNSSLGDNRATVGLVAQSGAGGFKLTDYGMGLAEAGDREQSWAKTHTKLQNQLNLREGTPDRNFPKNESRTFTGLLTAPETAGTYTLSFAGLSAAVTPTSDMTKFTIEVIDDPNGGGSSGYIPTEPTYTTAVRDADVQLVRIPDAVVNKTTPLTFVVKNVGKLAWTATKAGEAGYYLRLRIGSETQYLPVTANTEAGKTATFTYNYTAPAREGTPDVTAQMVYRTDGAVNKFFGDIITDEIFVDLDMGNRGAKVLSVKYPDEMLEGTKGVLEVEVLNTGDMIWGNQNKVVLSELKDKAYLSGLNTADDAVILSAIEVEPGVTVANGERYIFRADLHSWTLTYGKVDYVRPNTDVAMTLRLNAVSGNSLGYFGDKITTSTRITMNDYVAPFIDYANSADHPVDQTMTHKAVLLKANVPEIMAMGQIVPVELTFKNIGTTSWFNSADWSLNKIRLRTETNGAFDMVSNFEGTAGWTSARDRVPMEDSINSKNPVDPGETYTFKFFLKAPDSPGTFTFSAYLINDGIAKGQGAFEENTYGVSFPVQIGETPESKEIELPVSSARYDVHGLMATALGNADYYIANKAFFWDLAMDETIAPLDDRSQPVGTDVKVLRQLLDSQRKRAQAYEDGKDPWNKVAGVGEGFGIFQVGGFLPWYQKYCTESDKASSYSAAHQEWQQMMHISEYGGGSDADAYGTITIANCSVFSKLKNNVKKFSENVTQAQPDFNPAVGDPTVKYDPDKTYILYHMGDWDGSSWTASILAPLWETDPRRGEIPVGWAIAAGNSLRIPQVFNWQYDNATPNDYFIAGDNGTNYYDPNMNSRPHTDVTGITKQMGLEILDDFVAYNQYFNDIFSIDITGLLHTAGSGPSDDTVREAFHKITPYGVGVTQEGANTKMEDCGNFVGADGKITPYVPSTVFTTTSDGTLKSTPESLGASLATKIKYGPQFQILRTVKVRVTSLIEIMEAMEAANPGIDEIYEVVDPYTFMRLYKEANGGFMSRGRTEYTVSRAGAVKVDGKISAGEWDAAKEMNVSPTSAEVAKSGKNWNVTSLATDADLSSKFRVTWDNNYLYVMENRTDDGFIATAKADGIDWTADTGALYISTDGAHVGNGYYKGDNAIIFNIGTDGQPNLWIRQGGDGANKTERKMVAGEYTAAFTRGAGGNYVYEVAIPWSVLGDFRPAYGKQVGITALAIDGDEGLVGGGRQIMWAGAGDDQTTWALGTLK